MAKLFQNGNWLSLRGTRAQTDLCITLYRLRYILTVRRLSPVLRKKGPSNAYVFVMHAHDPNTIQEGSPFSDDYVA